MLAANITQFMVNLYINYSVLPVFSFPGPHPASCRLQYGTASNGKLQFFHSLHLSSVDSLFSTPPSFPLTLPERFISNRVWWAQEEEDKEKERTKHQRAGCVHPRHRRSLSECWSRNCWLHHLVQGETVSHVMSCDVMWCHVTVIAAFTDVYCSHLCISTYCTCIVLGLTPPHHVMSCNCHVTVMWLSCD